MATITPTVLTSHELANHLEAQAAPLRDLFDSKDHQVATGARVVYDEVTGIATALATEQIAPVVAQVRLLRVNARAGFYGLPHFDAHEVA